MFQDSTRQDRSDTRAAKLEERAATAKQVWAEVEAKSKARDENIDRLKAARLAREAATAAEAAAAVAPRKRKVSAKSGAQGADAPAASKVRVPKRSVG